LRPPALSPSPARRSPASGNYVFDGGTPAEQQQVRDALAASSFNWSLVARPVTIHIGSFATEAAAPGEIFLDARYTMSVRGWAASASATARP